MGALDDEAVPDRDLPQIACEFGYQFASFDELYSPLSWRTWEEDLSPLRLLCQVRRQALHTGEREARRHEVLAARGALLARAQEADPEAAALLRQVLDLAVRCMSVRADKDLCLSFAFAVHRKYLLELGARVFGGKAPERMFEATMEEVLEFCACEKETLPPPTQAAVARRCRHHHVFEKMSAPLTLPVAPEAEPRTVRAGDVIEGSPGAAGTAVGQVRVLPDIRELGALKPGEVMVTPDIKPVWALAFGLASGIITANGHLLAHGAIMAREAGIPCVFIGDRMDGLHTGDLVRVIGEQGRVEILSHAS